MMCNPERRHRRSIRLQGYDYTRAGAYFTTICTQQRACLFGDVAGGKMTLNDPGRMVQTVWNEIPDHYPGIDVDAFVIMPNHIHGIIIIVGAGPCACPETGQPGSGQPITGQPITGQPITGQPITGQPQGVAPTLSLSDVVHRFKTLTTKRYVDGVKHNGRQPFPGKLWQRNYYEHIIRDDESLNQIRQYILDNPAHWAFDRELREVDA